MNRGQYPIFAKGSETNLLAATAVFLITILGKFASRNKLFTVLLWLVTPAWLIVLYFFRDPERITPKGEHLVIAPGDGEIVAIEKEHDGKFLNKEVLRVSIFLSLLDVHVQRNPISGRVVNIHYQDGQYLQAFRPEASEVNEYIAMHIENETYGEIVVKQIAGIMARRCVNHQAVGDHLVAGERFGMIRFGSRVDLFLPTNTNLLVGIGDKVEAGRDLIGTLEPLESKTR